MGLVARQIFICLVIGFFVGGLHAVDYRKLLIVQFLFKPRFGYKTKLQAT